MSEGQLVADPETLRCLDRVHIELYSPTRFSSNGIPDDLGEFALENGCPSHDLRWLMALRDGLGHSPYCATATKHSEVVGLLPVVFVKGFLFGRFLVGLPYLNSSGLRVNEESAAGPLVDRAVQLADELDVRYLELRHEVGCDHPKLTENVTTKVHMRLRLPRTAAELWDGLKAKVRNQIRKARKYDLLVDWGGDELLHDFYEVFSTNMRDLGSPSYGRELFSSVLRYFPGEAEFCVVRSGGKPLAAALLIHGATTTEVPSASALRKYNSMNPNMLMYWSLLERAVERGQQEFDFGRSSKEGNTYKFKKQWGAQPSPAVWQYYLRKGQVRDMRPEGGRFDRLIALWKRLPVPVTRILGPRIVRGIP